MPFDFFSAGGSPAASTARRCPEGSIDYEHYRRAAARERARTFTRAATRLSSGLAHTLFARARSMIRPRASARVAP